MSLNYNKILTSFKKEEKNEIGIYYAFSDSHTGPCGQNCQGPYVLLLLRACLWN